MRGLVSNSQLPASTPWGVGMRQNAIAHEALRLYFIENKTLVETHELLEWHIWVTLGLVEELICIGEELDQPLREATLEAIQMDMDMLDEWGELRQDRKKALLNFKEYLTLPKLEQPHYSIYSGH